MNAAVSLALLALSFVAMSSAFYMGGGYGFGGGPPRDCNGWSCGVYGSWGHNDGYGATWGFGAHRREPPGFGAIYYG